MSARYSQLENVSYNIHQNKPPIQFVDCELLFDNYKNNKVFRFKLKNNTNEMVAAAVVTIRFHKLGKLLTIRNYLIQPYHGLKARPNDLFGLDTELLFPDKEVNKIEIGITKVYVVRYAQPKSAKIAKPIENKVCIFSDVKYMGKTPLPAEILRDKSYIDNTERQPASTRKKAGFSSVGLAAVLIMSMFGSCWNNNNRYDEAFRLFSRGQYTESMLVFMNIYKYKDAWDRYFYARNRYELSGGDQHIVFLNNRNPIGFSYDSNQEKVVNILSDVSDIDTVSAQASHTVAVAHDGGILTDGTTLPTEPIQWTDISRVSANRNHIVGLQKDGKVVATGNNDDGQCDVESWTGILNISAGLKHTVGLKEDHTAIATQYQGDDYEGQCDVGDWKDLKSIAAGGYFTLGLKDNGKVLVTPINNNQTPIDTKSWKNIVSISASESHAVGLKSDGTVVATGDDTNRQCDVEGWGNIVNIYAGNGYTLGLTSDKAILVVGSFSDGDEEIKEAIERYNQNL